MAFQCPVVPGPGLALPYESLQYFSLRITVTLGVVPNLVVHCPCCHLPWQMCSRGVQRARTCRLWAAVDHSLGQALKAPAKLPTDHQAQLKAHTTHLYTGDAFR